VAPLFALYRCRSGFSRDRIARDFIETRIKRSGRHAWPHPFLSRLKPLLP
jgi:hypothetical protein